MGNSGNLEIGNPPAVTKQTREFACKMQANHRIDKVTPYHVVIHRDCFVDGPERPDTGAFTPAVWLLCLFAWLPASARADKARWKSCPSGMIKPSSFGK
jgi:hypothetical protein